ncbi:IS3 family transposase [Paenibacillus sp. NPDC057934]|uniref:IS3 family transposase n=1 Tax=Paenibacillus sp. NPDC057934 TaxID=3346282 RepID=UPI0036DEFCBE
MDIPECEHPCGRQAISVNHKKVWRLMRELSIQSVIRKKRNRSNYASSVFYSNRLKHQLHATANQQKLMTDITYPLNGTHFYYLSVVQDIFKNEIEFLASI